MNADEMLLLSREFSLVLFFLLFVGILFWAFWPKNKERFDREARRILEDRDENG
jgi:cbb3-type cytochrome oxidase subunit 3